MSLIMSVNNLNQWSQRKFCVSACALIAMWKLMKSNAKGGDPKSPKSFDLWRGKPRTWRCSLEFPEKTKFDGLLKPKCGVVRLLAFRPMTLPSFIFARSSSVYRKVAGRDSRLTHAASSFLPHLISTTIPPLNNC